MLTPPTNRCHTLACFAVVQTLRKTVSANQLEIPDQVTHAHAERIGDELQGSDRHDLLAALQPVEVSAVETGQFGELVLRNALSLPYCLYSFGNHVLNIVFNIVLQCLQHRRYAVAYCTCLRTGAAS